MVRVPVLFVFLSLHFALSFLSIANEGKQKEQEPRASLIFFTLFSLIPFPLFNCNGKRELKRERRIGEKQKKQDSP